MVTAHATRGSHEDDSGLAFRVLGYPCGCQALRLTQAAEFESPAGILALRLKTTLTMGAL